jgi:hypothetical protein
MQWSEARVRTLAAADAPPAPPERLGGGYYCALMGHPFDGLYKKDTYTFVDADPVHAVVLHNRRLVNNKETRAVAPFWRLVVAVGPFASPDAAAAFGRDWVHNTRGAASKRRRGIALAKERGVPYYTEQRRRTPAQTAAYLRAHAPRVYLKAYRRLQAAAQRE